MDTIDLINITSVPAEETNVDWYEDGEFADDTVLNRPVQEVAAFVNLLIENNNIFDSEVLATISAASSIDTDTITAENIIANDRLSAPSETDNTGNQGDIRYNTDVASFQGHNGSEWGEIGGGATGTSGNNVFFENEQIVTYSYEITTGKNAVSAGPIQIGQELTISNIVDDASDTTITVSEEHLCSVSDTFTISGTTNFDGDYTVTAITDDFILTAASSGSAITAETAGTFEKDVDLEIPDGSVWTVV